MKTLASLSKRYPQQRAFITGAASGLGRALAWQLASAGWTVGISDIQLDRLSETAAGVASRGGKALSFQLDVSDRDQFEQVSTAFLSAAGGIDLLVNNAGVGDGAPFMDYHLQNWDWMISINQMGVIHGCYFFLPQFKTQGQGHILNIASIAAFTNNPYMSAYCSTKAAVRSLSESMMYELKPVGIEVSVAMPAFFQSNVMKTARGPAEMRRFAETMMQRSGQSPDQVSEAILKGVEKGRFEIWISRQAWIIFQIKKFFPAIYRSRIKRLHKVLDQM